MTFLLMFVFVSVHVTWVYPKSVIRYAVSVSDWENEASGHLARFCPNPVSRYAFG